MTNTEIRTEIKKKRSSMTETEVFAYSDIIFDKIKELDFVFKKQNFMIYKDFKNEVKTDKIIDLLTRFGKTVAHPITLGDNMIAAIPQGNETTLDSFGIEIPKNYSIMDMPEVIFVPLVACDENKNRLGFGKGYYDKYLSGRKVLKIGLCYDFQVTKEIAAQPWDVPLDMIITEKRIIR